jgi:hypothetical protein
MGISIITEKGGNKEPKDQTTTPTNKTSSGIKFFIFYFFIFSLLCSRKILFWPNEKVAKPHESSRHIFSYYFRLFFLGRLPSMMWLFKFDFFFFGFVLALCQPRVDSQTTRMCS